jgi:ATP/ADP translocase
MCDPNRPPPPNVLVYFAAHHHPPTQALIFSLYDPVKELLYMPTNEEVKFKAKAWIDVFGARFAKAVGSLFTSAAHGNLEVL